MIRPANVVLAAVLLDQTTKAAALSGLVPGQPVAILPGLDLTLGFNEGASFGLLSGPMSGRPLLMAAVSAGLALVFAVMALRARHPVERTGFALIVGGALGNIIDRLRQGAVTDFLDVSWQDWHWPTFNVADMAIILGAACLLASSLPQRRRKEPVRDQG